MVEPGPASDSVSEADTSYLAILLLLRDCKSPLSSGWSIEWSYFQRKSKNIEARIFLPLSYLGSLRRVGAGGCFQKCIISIQVSAAPQMQILSYAGLGFGLCRDMSRNTVSLSGHRGLQRLWSLPMQNIHSNPKIKGSYQLPRSKPDNYERKKFHFFKLGTESICSMEGAGN